jgi:hypothetical protein
MIERAVRLLFKPDQIVELRIPNTAKGVVSGYYNRDELIEAVYAAGCVTSPNIYWTIQQIKPKLLERSPNHAKISEITTRDEDVERYRWLPIDCDPERKSGINATDEEKAAAYDVALRVQGHLACLDFEWMISSVLADSGNGYHLLVPIDLEANAASKDLIRHVLVALNAQFGTDAVTIDRTVYNPARILKAYGTISRKGENTPERPYRLTGLIDVPEPLQVMPREALEYIAATAPEAAAIEKMSAASLEVIDESAAKMEKFLAAAGIKHGKRKVHSAGYKWIVECPFNVDHTGTSCAVFILADGRFGFKCLHDGCLDNHWQEFRSQAETNIGHPFPFVDAAPEFAVSGAADVATPATAGSSLRMRRVSDVEIKSVQWLWDRRIPFGKISLFVGNPDQGKSLASLYVAAMASTGRDWFDCKNNTPLCEVLILIGEDDVADTTAPRLKVAGADLEKIHQLESVIVADGKGKTQFQRDAQLDGDLKMIEAYLTAHPEIRLVVIDPLSDYLGSAKMNDEQSVRAILGPIKNLAEKLNIAILCIMHLNKKTDLDAIHRVGGAMAFTGKSRAVWMFMDAPEDDGEAALSAPTSIQEDLHQMVRVKCNIARKDGGLTYKIESRSITIQGKEDYAPAIVFTGVTRNDANSDKPKQPVGRPAVQCTGAAKWLVSFLSGGERPANEVYEAANAAGYGGSVKRAKTELEIKSVKRGDRDNQWFWSLPTQSEPENLLPY